MNSGPSLPRICGITAAALCGGVLPFLRHLDRAIKRDTLKMLLVRDRELPRKDRELLARECVRRGLDNGCTVLICDDYGALARLTGADGVHHSSARLAKSLPRENRPRIVGASVHNADEASLASMPGRTDYAMLSPVRKTATHPDARALGWNKFGQIAATIGVPVYALGGLSPTDLSLAISNGAHGVAAMRSIWSLPHAR